MTSAVLEDGMRPIHPGEILKDEIEALNLSLAGFARLLKVPHNRISELVRGQRALSADTALRLARLLGTSADFWLDLQKDYDLKIARAKAGDTLAEITPLAA